MLNIRQKHCPVLPCILLILITSLLFLQSCTTTQAPQPLPQMKYRPQLGPAISLYNKAETSLQSGQLDSAVLLLERALRIEPRNPHYWYTLAKVKYMQGDYGQTIQFCLKTASLTANRPQIAALNKELLQQAQQKQI